MHSCEHRSSIVVCTMYIHHRHSRRPESQCIYNDCSSTATRASDISIYAAAACRIRKYIASAEHKHTDTQTHSTHYSGGSTVSLHWFSFIAAVEERAERRCVNKHISTARRISQWKMSYANEYTILSTTHFFRISIMPPNVEDRVANLGIHYSISSKMPSLPPPPSS